MLSPEERADKLLLLLDHAPPRGFHEAIAQQIQAAVDEAKWGHVSEELNGIKHCPNCRGGRFPTQLQNSLLCSYCYDVVITYCQGLEEAAKIVEKRMEEYVRTGYIRTGNILFRQIVEDIRAKASE